MRDYGGIGPITIVKDVTVRVLNDFDDIVMIGFTGGRLIRVSLPLPYHSSIGVGSSEWYL